MWGEAVTKSVNINGLSGEQAESLQIEPVDNYILLDNRIPGYIDSAFDFSVTGDFETAIISFEFDAALLEDENFVPRIYYFNEETQYLEELPNQVVQGNVVSVETTHFSKYILLDKPKLDAVRENNIQPPDDISQEITGIDVVIAVDTSFNMVSSDPMRKRVSIAKSFVDKLGVNDRAAVCTFDILGIFRQDFTNDHDLLYEVLDVNYYLSECNLSSAMQVINQWFTKESYTRTDAKKCGIIFTDGKGDYSSVHTNMAAENGIEVYTVGLGNHVNEELLKAIASGTGGQYFNSSDINTPSLLYSAIRKGVSTGTGGSTVIEDSNNDGIKNGDEAKLSFNAQDNSPQIYYASDPCQKDGDNDGIPDSEDTAPFEKGLEGGIIGNITLIAAYDSGMGSDAFKSGHAFLLYESYVNDSINFSNFSSGWSKKDNNDVWSSSNIQRDDELKSNYEVYPHDILTIGNGALTAGFAHLGNIFGGGSSSNGSSGGSSSGGGSSGSSSSGDGSSSGGGSSGGSSSGGSSSGESSSGGSASEANGSSYNMEIYKSCDLGYTYLKNTAISMKITEANLNTVIEYFGREEENYWSAFHNCATVASSAWNLISEEKVNAEYMAGVATPRALSNDMSNKDGHITDYNFSGLLEER